jgi:hypothetical protein
LFLQIELHKEVFIEFIKIENIYSRCIIFKLLTEEEQSALLGSSSRLRPGLPARAEAFLLLGFCVKDGTSGLRRACFRDFTRSPLYFCSLFPAAIKVPAFCFDERFRALVRHHRRTGDFGQKPCGLPVNRSHLPFPTTPALPHEGLFTGFLNELGWLIIETKRIIKKILFEKCLRNTKYWQK